MRPQWSASCRALDKVPPDTRRSERRRAYAPVQHPVCFFCIHTVSVYCSCKLNQTDRFFFVQLASYAYVVHCALYFYVVVDLKEVPPTYPDEVNLL